MSDEDTPVTRGDLEAAFAGRLPPQFLDLLESQVGAGAPLPGEFDLGGVCFFPAARLLAATEPEGGKGKRVLPTVLPFASDRQAVAQGEAGDDLASALRALGKGRERVHYAFDLTKAGAPVLRLQLDKGAAEQVAPSCAQFLQDIQKRKT